MKKVLKLKVPMMRSSRELVDLGPQQRAVFKKSQEVSDECLEAMMGHRP